ncbi:MAG TPA: XrtB/PEP-CTERM-associated transcriptional regulator EpsA [Burkholderiales bacterium]|nr:XrtB/PEP-CTERM-associated transcriptional regulator EpsA [Burkholderiales bacterium]
MESQPAGPSLPSADLPHRPYAAVAGITSLDVLDLESLTINFDISLRVHTSHHFFNWTQGSLQSLVRHELLICALCEGKPVPSHYESYTSIPLDLARFGEMLGQDSTWMPHFVGAWERNHRRPVICDARDPEPLVSGILARELRRLDATCMVGHGTHDAGGRPVSFFIFACRQGAPVARQAYLLELIVPFVHAAWMRVRSDASVGSASAQTDCTGLLTSREVEILKWLYHGKSNVEIGLILEISPMTVKNHVQKVLRKLNVLNRTQAIGKALALRILNV